MKKHRSSAAIAGLVLTTLAVSGCGAPPWATPSTPTPGASRSSSASAVPTPIPNDLSSGSTQRTITAGPVTATVDYWSTVSMDKWTSAALKPLSVSLISTVAPDDGQKVYLQRSALVATPYDGSQALAPLEAQTDSSTVSPGYLVLSPYSYSQTFSIGSLPPEADRVSIEMRYDFLIQTTPTSSEYAKQTASDTLTVAVARE